MDGIPPPGLIDVVALGLIALGSVRGFFRGLSAEISQLVSVVIAVLVGARYFAPCGQWMEAHTRLEGRAAVALAFAATVLTCFLLLLAVRFILKRIIKIVVVDTAEKPGGAIAGGLHAALIIVIGFALMNIIPHAYLNEKFGEESFIGSVVLRAMPDIQAFAEGMPLPDLPGEAQ